MSLGKRTKWLLSAAAGLAMLWATPIFAIQAGITFDVHQDVQCQPGVNCPNDFHVEGLICSNSGVVPTLISHIDFPFTQFSYTIVPAGLPDPCWYYFQANWWAPLGGDVPFCTVIHLGLLFDVEGQNTIIDLHGWWTLNGQRIGQVVGGQVNGGFVPQVGFSVDDTAMPQFIRVANGNVISPPPPVPPIQIELIGMDLIPFPPGSPPALEDLQWGGGQDTWPGWTPVLNPNGQPISPSNPQHWQVDSFFDVFFQMPQPGQFTVANPFDLAPGGFLVARQRLMFRNNSGEFEEQWFWEIHGAQQTEACCFTDGQCADLVPFFCLQQGGQPWGPGTSCLPTNPCPVVEQGACCYGTAAPLCIVTDRLTCEQQYLGEYKGDGTTCDDNDGNGVADICESATQDEACCLPDGTCQMLPRLQCLQLNGEPKGPGSQCLGDLNGNGKDDICEAKWLQLPDLEPTGIDIMDSYPVVLADDFLCTQRSRITEIVVWGSWKYDEIPGGPANVGFTLSFHRDIPANPPEVPYSRPGEVLWVRQFQPGAFQVRPYMTGINEGWMDPRNMQYIFPGDHVCWEYRFQVPATEAFCQEGSPEQPLVYWLDVQAAPQGTTQAQFGWKTSLNHWNDDAVWGVGQEPYPGPWNELHYPPEHQLYPQSIDLAFALAGDQPCEEHDFGDAPDVVGAAGYQTLLANNGAQHLIVPNMFLGALIDAEPDGQPVPAGFGDDVNGLADEDGVFFATPLIRGSVVPVTVTASAPGLLNAWVDFNANFSWADAGEQVYVNVLLNAGPNLLNLPVPQNAKCGTTFARFRFSSVAVPSFGLAPDGEVEDYAVVVVDNTPPIITAAASIKQHGAAGLFSIDLINPLPAQAYPVECRTGGPTRIVVTFDEPIVAATGTPADVCITGGNVTGIAVVGNVLTINAANVLQGMKLVTFPGVSDDCGNIVTGTLCFAYKIGDVTGNRITNAQDITAVKVSQGPTTAANFRRDVNASGVINAQDITATKNNQGSVTGNCPPTCP